jgi:hypothetical protein
MQVGEGLKAALEGCMTAEAFPVLGKDAVASYPYLARLPSSHWRSLVMKTEHRSGSHLAMRWLLHAGTHRLSILPAHCHFGPPRRQECRRGTLNHTHGGEFHVA